MRRVSVAALMRLAVVCPAAVLSLAGASAQGGRIPEAFLETARPYVERLEECRVLGETRISACFKGVYDDEIRIFQKCLGSDAVPRDLTVEQYGCVYVEISADIF